mmetsp:Transcript_36524/g.77706  ORF Transcript_36524/g.77706 Transcript_36524/m.77706 type:complete len:180 (-) Transcript_36524:262-801(-)|eukprot:CAMPEP_0206580064 /NCGR_PEP_ID=MMETSP0325_2-20121206/32925_1 /ASSEMBLY_ACC=CAM_ASM_000347 /TAXON_ID=2866 /ORGANISM="Crypthecodinium cohnii, Strain Seligo" /LENGTH=179 /DNA_ID=CAMNT_0054086001 /DNA_START=228 /DNA_END=767 /DNA_ORIENTATION=-
MARISYHDTLGYEERIGRENKVLKEKCGIDNSISMEGSLTWGGTKPARVLHRKSESTGNLRPGTPSDCGSVSPSHPGLSQPQSKVSLSRVGSALLLANNNNNNNTSTVSTSAPISTMSSHAPSVIESKSAVVKDFPTPWWNRVDTFDNRSSSLRPEYWPSDLRRGSSKFQKVARGGWAP